MPGHRRLVMPVVVLASGMVAAPALGQVAARPAGLDLYLPTPPDNPMRADVIALGRRLFFDPALSRDSSLACASCHQPENGFTDGRRVSVGVFGREGTRNVPAILNRGYGRAFFWDGRMSDLEAQVVQPILAEIEMDMSLDEVVQRLHHDRGYPDQFRAAFGRTPNQEDLGRALAAYVRTIQSGGSRFDELVAGDTLALTEVERAGLRLFQGKARCVLCHVGTNLTDESFHNTGVAWVDGILLDPGRYRVTGVETDRGAFKTPTLRHVERTAPYMHDGSIATLEKVVEFYDRGGNANPYQDDRIKPLKLSDAEKDALLAFLRTLTGQVREGR